jgi:hypothetical protein
VTYIIEDINCFTADFNKNKVSLHLKRSWATEEEETTSVSAMTDAGAAEHKLLRSCRKLFSVPHSVEAER